MFPRLFPLKLNSQWLSKEMVCDYGVKGFASQQDRIFSILHPVKTSNNSGLAERYIDMKNKQ
jgi:hypothetical protein